MSGSKAAKRERGAAGRLKSLRETADRAHRAVRAEEDRQRHAYNYALDALYDELERVVGGSGWVTGQGSRKYVRLIKARPGWAAADTLELGFAFAEEFSPDIHEDPLNTAVSVTWLPSGEMCRFTQPPALPVLKAVVEAYMKLAQQE